MFEYVGGVPILLCKTSGCSVTSGWSGEGEGASEDILARLTDGKRGPEADESQLIPHGKV